MLNIGDTVTSGTAVFVVKSYKKAEALEAARTITLAGDVTGSISFDGSSDVTINTTLASGAGDSSTTASEADISQIMSKFNTDSSSSGDSGGGSTTTEDTVAVASDEDISKLTAKFS